MLSWEAPGVMLSSIECADDGRLFTRLWEASGEHQQIELAAGVPLQGARLADLMEREGEPLQVEGAAVRLTLRPFEIANVVLRP